jgi:hypothetical protein
LAFAKPRERLGQSLCTPAEWRAAIYDQAGYASQLEAFLFVSKYACFELGTAALKCVSDGILITSYIALRSLIERIAHANFIADKVKGIEEANENPDRIYEVGEQVVKALYGTQINWLVVSALDFRKDPPKSAAYVREQLRADESSFKIMNSIDKLGKTVSGTRLAYDLLCEFLHPNVGDLMSATVGMEAFTDKMGTKHLERRLGLASKLASLAPEYQLVEGKLFEICIDIVRYAPDVFARLQEYSRALTKVTRSRSHKMYRKNRTLFTKDDPCPCLSGRSIKDCTRRLTLS